MAGVIRQLSVNLINQIAAGEVIERPASIIKELVENAIDAGANNINVSIEQGGKSSIIIADDGVGMILDDLKMCLMPHATSKLNQENLNAINTLGFRGEALPSIASISKIKIASKHKNGNVGHEINAYNGVIQDIKPSSIKLGTIVHVSDVFFSVPARLKFLRSDQVESSYCYSLFKRIAISNPQITFTLSNNGKEVFNFTASKDSNISLKNRVKQILGEDFINNSLLINQQGDGFLLSGFISLPTYHKNHTNDQYMIVNNRVLKDKNLASIIRVAYGDSLVYGKNPSYVLFLNVPNEEIDVNVNPTKTEVRFKDAGFVRHFLLSSIKALLSDKNNQNVDSNLSNKILNTATFGSNFDYKNPIQTNFKLKEDIDYFNEMKVSNIFIPQSSNLQNLQTHQNYQEEEHILGFAKAQYHSNWIVSQVKDGLVIVDQHASHERITHQELKKQYEAKKVTTQLLLVQDLIELKKDEINILEIYKESIQKLGILFDFFGESVILVKELPSILGNANAKLLIADLYNFF